MNLTPIQLARVCGLAYFDPPRFLLARIGHSLTMGQLARAMLKEGAPCGPQGDAVEALTDITTDPVLSALKVICYINHNDSNGFVGFAFADEAGSVLCAFRGSESREHCAPSNVDWWDNVMAPFDGSIQYADIARFMTRYEQGDVLITGHSKGAHNALYALATSVNPKAHCVCFDGQGFLRGQLSPKQSAALRARAINYVQRNDIVGALLYHPERRIFVKATPEGNAHALTSMVFDEEGWPVPAHRTLRSMATEIASRSLATGINEATGHAEGAEGNGGNGGNAEGAAL